MKFIRTFLLFIILSELSFSQNVGIGINNPNTNAKLEIYSDNKGILIPRMDSIQRKNIINTKGLLLYDSTSNSFWYNNGTAWQELLNRSAFIDEYYNLQIRRNIKKVTLTTTDSAYTIQPEDYTILIATTAGMNNGILHLPDASTFKGRLLNLINWSRNSNIILNPVVKSSMITTINQLSISGSNAHMIIQSTGDEWVEVSND